METPHHTTNIDHRLTELEIKASFTEDLLDQLDKIIIRQQQHIDLLMHEVAKLRPSSTEGAATGISAARNLRDELPPHF